MLLELGKRPIFKSWPKAPKYRTLSLSELLVEPEEFIDHKTKLKVSIDVDILNDEVNFIKEALVKAYKPREMTFLPYEERLEHSVDEEDLKFESIDQIIIEHLSNIESNVFDNNFLIDIYRNL